MKVAVNRLKAGIRLQSRRGGGNGLAVAVDAVQPRRAAGKAQNALAVAAAAQRAVQIDAVGPGRHPFHNLVKEDRHMMKCVVHASSVKAGRFPGPHRLLTKCGMQGPQALAGVWGGVPSPVPQHNRRERRERPTGARNAPLSKTA